MTKLKVETLDNKAKWEKFVTSHPEANFLQSWNWGEFHKSLGKTIVRRAVIDGKKIIGVYVGSVECARRGTHLAIAGGPIIDWTNKSAVKKLFADIKAQAQAHDCVFARVRPQLELSEKSEKLFANLGLKPAPMYLSVEHAGVLDLTKTEDEILKGMRQRLRRALRKAKKNNIEISVSTDPKDVKEFYKVQMETAGRHKFVAFSENFLQKQFEAFVSDGQVILYTARHNGELLAQNYMMFYGNEASYHYGASTYQGTRLSGAPLLHMKAMADARERGIKRYNFWGIVDEGDTKHRYYGVSMFKRGFGVEDLKYLPAHDLVINKPKYLLTKIFESIRRKYRKV